MMTEEDLGMWLKVLGLERAFSLFPDAVRAAATTAAEEHEALNPIDDPSVEPA